MAVKPLFESDKRDLWKRVLFQRSLPLYAVRTMPFVDLKKLYTQPPPAFGKELLKHFAMDPDYVNLNNGSYGTPPRAVLQSAFDISLEVESNPEAFHRYGYKGRLDQARGELAELIGAHKDEVFLVNNASTGVGTVMRNFVWEEGDVIITFSTSYAAIANQAQYISDVPPHPRVVSFPLVFPKKHSDIISSFTEFISSPSAQAKGPNNKRVVVIDSIVSNPGALLPWKELVKISKEKGIWTVVDAAHSIGQEVGLNLGEAGPDFWTSNCHKWLYAKRSCAVLYIPFRNQHIIKTTLPTSNYYIPLAKRNGDPNLVAQFELFLKVRFPVPPSSFFRLDPSLLPPFYARAGYTMRYFEVPEWITECEGCTECGPTASASLHPPAPTSPPNHHHLTRPTTPSSNESSPDGMLTPPPYPLPALKFRKWLGGEQAINDYCHDLAVKGGKRLQEVLGTEGMDPEGEITLNMVNVVLPIPTKLVWSVELYEWLNKKLIEEHKTYSAWFKHGGKWWTRVSVQVFNEIDDFDVLGKAWKEVSKELEKAVEEGKFKTE
ncbi:hypothetical protein NMY22_g10196 [Coprinellus aureogranulatus]|nr:hypothetical protein NMY22_g10196 [Coprinellus aureogranulatus]